MRGLLADVHVDTTALQRSELELLSQYQVIQAKVVSNSVNHPNNMMTINKGRVDGIETDMGVACGNGLVGVVYLTSDHYSVIIPVLNYQSHISVTIRGRGYFGYMTWDGGSPVEAYVEDVPRHAQFKVGDWVETSGYSSIFPSGITVGKIIEISDSEDGLSYRLKVHLSTDFANLRDVCVITEHGFVERMHLLEAAKDSLTIR